MRYKALTNVHHDGVKYVPGDMIELSEVEAKPLLEAKAIEPNAKPFSKQFEKTALHSDSLEN